MTVNSTEMQTHTYLKGTAEEKLSGSTNCYIKYFVTVLRHVYEYFSM